MSEAVEWFAEARVEALLDPGKLVDAVERAFLALVAGDLVEPPRVCIDAVGRAANYASFPAYWPEAGIAAVKVLSGVEGNPVAGRPLIDAVIVVLDAVTGAVRAILSGRRLTALRTAATTAVAVRRLAPVNVQKLALIGTGAQALAHAEALAAVRAFDEIAVASPSGAWDRASAVATGIARRLGVPAHAATVADAMRDADVIVVATLRRAPVIGMDNLALNATVVSVGPFGPDGCEIDPAIVLAAEIVVSDQTERLREQWRDSPAVLPKRIVDLPDLLARSHRTVHGLRVFLSDGRALEDLAAARVVLEASSSRGETGLRLPP